MLDTSVTVWSPQTYYALDADRKFCSTQARYFFPNFSVSLLSDASNPTPSHLILSKRLGHLPHGGNRVHQVSVTCFLQRHVHPVHSDILFPALCIGRGGPLIREFHTALVLRTTFSCQNLTPTPFLAASCPHFNLLEASVSI